MNEFIKYQPRNNIAYLLNPKVACTTLQNSLLNGAVANVHDINNFPSYNNSSVPIFTVVRNPFDRAVSAYLDKVVSKQDQVVWKNFMLTLGKEVTYDISFEEYLDILLEHPKLSQADKHFRPQFNNMQGITPSYVGYLEDMESVKGYLANYGIDIINKIPHKTNTKNKKTVLLESVAVINKIKQIYSEDFKQFGYSTDPDEKFNLSAIIQKQAIPSSLISSHINIVSERFADVFRRASLICENEDEQLAFELIELALKIRPEGPVILDIYNRLKIVD